MGFVEKNGLRFYQFTSFLDLPIFHAILTRHGGVSKSPYASLNTGGTVGDDPQAVLENHQRIYRTLEYDFGSRFDVWQVHDNRVLCTDSPRGVDHPHQKADGILTNQPDVTLFMRFADCVPILLVDPVIHVIGIVHAGWQGTYKKIAQSAVEKMVSCYGSNPNTLLAGIGPSICQKCYEVGSEVQDVFFNVFGEGTHDYIEEKNGRLFLNLWQANRAILHQAGVKQVETAGICTACNLRDWYSHRAEGHRTGRFAVLMTIEHN